jgi:EpsD family peptidyl-prolyl cis-trans isomerase
MKITPLWGITLLPIAMAIVAGCGNEADSKKVSTQVAARVNGLEITIHQVNNVLARAENVKPEFANEAKREILNRLIDQELAKQHAIDKKLDRSPRVMQAIEAARSDVLARAYMEQISAAQPKPTADEVKKYYAEHPELFSSRRVFSLEEILVNSQEQLATGLRAQVANGRSMKDVANWLNSRGTKFTVNRGVRAAEQIPVGFLSTLQAMKDGEIRLLESDDRLRVFHVVATQEAPIDEATAAPRIQQFLINQRVKVAVAGEMKQMRERANIVYLGEFAGESAPSEAETKPAAQAESPLAPQPPASPVEKGIRGLQ